MRSLGLVEEAYAAAKYDFADCVFLNHSLAGVSVKDGYAGTGTTTRAGRICYFSLHGTVLVPCNDHDGHVPGAEGQPTALASICIPPCKLSINSAAMKKPAQHLLKRVPVFLPL